MVVPRPRGNFRSSRPGGPYVKKPATPPQVFCTAKRQMLLASSLIPSSRRCQTPVCRRIASQGRSEKQHGFEQVDPSPLAQLQDLFLVHGEAVGPIARNLASSGLWPDVSTGSSAWAAGNTWLTFRIPACSSMYPFPPLPPKRTDGGRLSELPCVRDITKLYDTTSTSLQIVGNPL